MELGISAPSNEYLGELHPRVKSALGHDQDWESMRTLNRAALVIRPREPYLKWAAAIDDEAAEAAIPLRSRVSVYLVAEDPRGEEESAPLENYFEEIFDHELEAWYTDENRWPLVRDIVTFLEWFDVSRESIVLDLESYKLQTEDW